MRFLRLIRAVAGLGAFIASGAPASAAPAWPPAVYTFEGNPRTEARFELGRQLFYEPALSRDASTSCASCHQQAAAFAHPGHRLSHGIEGRLGTRNAPGLFNLAWDTSLMWDGSIAHLELQPLAPIANPAEMGMLPADLAPRLRAIPGYPERFAQAFGTPGIDTARILKALAQFTGALESRDAHYDRALAGREAFTPDQARGLVVFRARCAGCHAEPLFSDGSFRGNGLDAGDGADAGRATASANPADRGRFRVPSLRNVAVTAPYMHDGRLPTLEAVLDHYEHGVVVSAALDPQLVDGIRLTADDRAALLVFLGTLTDATLLSDRRFADPGAHRSRASAPRESWLTRFFAFSAVAHEEPVVTIASRDDRGSRLALSDDRVELLVAREGDVLRIYADDFATNAPLADLAVSVASGTLRLQAAVADGLYTVPADRLDPLQANALRITVRGDDWSRELSGILPPASAAAVPAGRRPWGAAGMFLAFAALLLAFLVVVRHARRTA
ncbi:MAG TPA: cytochrome c peroxidase [Nevskiaceae bacterium]|nr:cytochrome c peroxidase [Nevskiaceae bacterium]